VSEITFGAHGVDNPALMPAALDQGINTFFTSGGYLDGREEASFATMLRHRPGQRDNLVLIDGESFRPEATKAHVLSAIDRSLRRLGTDRIEVYLASEVCSPGDLRIEGLFEAFEEAKQAGKVLHLGLSGHCGGMQPCLEAAIADGRFEAFFIKYDFVSYPDQDEILRRAAQRGIGTIVFKTNAGNRKNEVRDLEAGGLSFHQATLRWALLNPDVASVAVTINSFDKLDETTGAMAAALSTAEIGMLRRYAGAVYARYCRFCKTCEAHCPRGVAIADVMRFAMYFDHYGREKQAMQLYRSLPAPARAAPCATCDGPCDAGCPFGRSVRAGLVAAHRTLAIEPA